jgi:hypothetical protein
VLWVVVGAWAFAVMVALVVLGFGAYEIAWKSARLRRDLTSLDHLRIDVSAVQAQLSSAQQHVAGLRTGH